MDGQANTACSGKMDDGLGSKFPKDHPAPQDGIIALKLGFVRGC